jgi:hypothetical protein
MLVENLRALVIFCGGVLFLLSQQTIFKVTIETHEAGAYRRVARGFRNPRRVRDAPLRISFLTLAVLLLFSVVLVQRSLHLSFLFVHMSRLIYISAFLSYSLIVLYLLACNPLPPCNGCLAE